MVDLEPQHARHQALQFIDTIQFNFASAVLAAARRCAALAVALMLAAILFRNFGTSNMYPDDPSFVFRAFDSIQAVMIATLLVLALCSDIVALITFGSIAMGHFVEGLGNEEADLSLGSRGSNRLATAPVARWLTTSHARGECY